MPCIFNNKPTDRHCEYCAAVLCDERPPKPYKIQTTSTIKLKDNMDYKEKYEQALERANDIKSGKVKLDKGEPVTDYIFPELAESEDEKIRKALILVLKSDFENDTTIHDISVGDIIAWLEKQGKQEQLYIRFGEIPTDEKSKIYQGEIEVGTENGVSVYPALKTSEGNIVLGLNLPITKTTLYTQQHLIEYDNRPCYLVKGDYVGKDIDGQPLINNVSIIEKIDNYRVKEEKQGDSAIPQVYETKNGEVITYSESEGYKVVEPKFKVGDWIVENGVNRNPIQITSFEEDKGVGIKVWFNNGTGTYVDFLKGYHKWTIQDAKDGDVLSFVTDEEDLWIMIYWSLYEPYEGHVHYHALLVNDNFGDKGTCCICIDDLKPATKEQRDLLFRKMKESGYEWSDKDRKLIKIVK